MKLDILFSGLEKLVTDMGAPLSNWKINMDIKKEIFIWSPSPYTYDPVDIEELLEKTKPSSIFEQNGEKFLVYIKGINNKFHFYKCRTLDDMQRKNRFNGHYVATARKDGLFFVDIPNGKEELRKLDVCKNCLGWYNSHYNDNSEVNNFSIADFFEKVTDTPIPQQPIYTDINSPRFDYPKNWDSIARSYKERHHWTCEHCHIDLKNNKNLLHVHHIKEKYNNQDDDLKALCVKCHSEQPSHQHMRVRFSHEISEISRLHRSQ